MLGSALVGTRRLELRGGDITTIVADVIVNAADSGLRGGGGVDGAIHHAAGPGLIAELRDRYASTPTGTAVITGAHGLAARWVIHAVGPAWRGGERKEAALLASAYRASLALADEVGARSVAFPAISCGIFGFPLAEAAAIALETVLMHLAGPTTVELVTFVLRGAEVQRAFLRALDRTETPVDGSTVNPDNVGQD